MRIQSGHGRAKIAELQQHPWWIGPLAYRRVTPLERPEVQTLHHLVHEERWVRRIQRVPREGRKQLPLTRRVRLEFDLTAHDCHHYQMTRLGSGS